ncbi:MAG: hypothetical protein AAFY49_10805 [Pseudomonadota bacterium]
MSCFDTDVDPDAEEPARAPANDDDRVVHTAAAQDSFVCEIVVLTRQGKPPLRFKGCLLTRHQVALSSHLDITVELWRRPKKGFVISYSYLDGARVGSKAIQISDLDEATDCLENVCANLETLAIKGGHADQLWTELHLHLCFKQHFHVLVADVLADWHLNPQLQESA